ncbi:GtrA family protein [Accumulibacter sp.]|uniref:GtrA family protein n=1 Tax=Accumulibacter sp. TaxID=2053492 RepID=UPI0025F0D0F8|nr:GtrA family protein [Accumulibacter sp.]MCM8595317.1 GtrA family protein [Accumulibacter sp.]MCM8625272.1 GtrA family protein [Accumulibacter sp.]MDS4049464.1 GtrA family protein [Accumulibacter sp.]
MKVIVVVPVRDATAGGKRLRELSAELAQTAHDLQLLIVELTASPGDATPAGLDGLCAKVHRLRVPPSLGSDACLRVRQRAVHELGADVLAAIDAPRSLRPGEISRLLAAVEAGADLVVGSRCAPTPDADTAVWSSRPPGSWASSVLVGRLAGIARPRDCTSGVHLARSSLLSAVDLTGQPLGGLGVALLHGALSQGARVVELPVAFAEAEHDRPRGQSRTTAEMIFSALCIRYRSLRTFLKFAIVGASGVVVNLGAFTILLNLGVNKYLASPLAIEASIVSNFLLNNFWTFRWRSTRGSLQQKGLKYNVVSLVALSVSYSTFVALSAAIPEMPPQLAQFLGIIPATLINYLLNSCWTFRHIDDSPTDIQELASEVSCTLRSSGSGSCATTEGRADHPVALASWLSGDACAGAVAPSPGACAVAARPPAA